MRTPRIYIDTSVVGGCLDQEFAEASNGLMEQARRAYIKAGVLGEASPPAGCGGPGVAPQPWTF